MEGVKRFFGVLLIAVAIWMVSSVIPAWLHMLAWAALPAAAQVSARYSEVGNLGDTFFPLPFKGAKVGIREAQLRAAEATRAYERAAARRVGMGCRTGATPSPTQPPP
jgi:thiol:disulfide interchange protein